MRLVQSDIYSTRCIHELFELQAEETPDRTAITDGEQTITYRQLNARSNRYVGTREGNFLDLHFLRHFAADFYVHGSLI